MPGLLPQRRAVLRSLASAAVLLAVPHFSQAQIAADEPKPDPEHTPEGAAEGAVAAGTKSKKAVLTVVVTGDDKPVGEAEVTVTFPSGGGDEAKLRTDTHGEATFESRGPGVARVRVIREGWVSARQEVNLKPGSQRVTIKLEPL